MSLLENQTPERIRSRVLARMDTELQTREGSFVYDMVSPMSFELWRTLMTLGELKSAFYVNEHSGPYLDDHANLLGMARRSGTKSVCEITFTGKENTIIPADTSFFAGDLEYHLTEDITIHENGSVGILEAAEVGERYNTDAGEINQILRSISGLESFLTGDATGGTDPEGDSALFSRIDYHRKNPSTSGNPNQYREWALSCDGIGGVKITELWAGPGTVRVLVAGYDKEPVDDTVVSNCAAYIQTKRPVGAAVTVISVDRLELTIEATVILAESAPVERVRQDFLASLSEYLNQITASYFQSDETYEYILSYKRIAALLICVDGVVDYTSFTVNGGTQNIVIPGTSVPACGEVLLT